MKEMCIRDRCKIFQIDEAAGAAVWQDDTPGTQNGVRRKTAEHRKRRKI